MTTAHEADAPSRRGYLIWILAGLILALLLPQMVERIQYAATHGAEMARLDAARSELGKFKDTAEAFRLVAQSIGPCVVHIDTARMMRRQLPPDEYGYWTRDGIYAARGQGSGVIVDADGGYIITNNHVIEGAQQIRVKLSDGRSVDALTVGADPLTDLAVLKIDADQLTAAPWGNSDALQVGDWVLAIGNPYGLDRSVTAGIISAKQRRVGDGSRPLDFLQTDAAVNPGNSGGPLVNLSGEVVGITTAIIGSAYQGISFAIPSNLARDVYERLRKGTPLATGWIGIVLDRLTPQLARQLQLSSTNGALVAAIVPNSPAAEAGLQAGDVVVAANGEPINDPGELIIRVGQTPIGQNLELTIVRNGQEAVVKVQVRARANLEPARRGAR